jgi:hypothetical protein
MYSNCKSNGALIHGVETMRRRHSVTNKECSPAGAPCSPDSSPGGLCWSRRDSRRLGSYSVVLAVHPGGVVEHPPALPHPLQVRDGHHGALGAYGGRAAERNQKANHYLHNADFPHALGWLRVLNTGDYLNYIRLAILAPMGILCYLVFLPGHIRRNDRIYMLICGLEVPVLGLATSVILQASGH